MSVCLVDTGILCEYLQVPNLCGRSKEISAQFKQKLRNNESLVLPVSTLLETGNHIGQNGDGRQRREVARRFVQLAEQAVGGEFPFIPTPVFKPRELLDWISHFPDWAGGGSGLGDLTILKEFERQCEIYRSRRVYIWSTDRHLSSYHREP